MKGHAICGKACGTCILNILSRDRHRDGGKMEIPLVKRISLRNLLGLEYSPIATPFC